MKATGIVRRIDDLGRVVIPKEIRRTLRIREGDPLEIFTDREGEVILKKYSPIGELANFAGQYAESIAQVLGCLVCPLRGATVAVPRLHAVDDLISTHAPLAGRDVILARFSNGDVISTHAPLAGRDLCAALASL